MPSSEAPSKFRKPGRLFWFLLATAVLVGLFLTLGPTLLLKLALARLVPSESGLTLEYTTARAGFLFRWAEVTDLTIGDRQRAEVPPLLALKRLRLEKLWISNLFRLQDHAKIRSQEPEFLAEEVFIEDLVIQQPHISAGLRQLYLRNPGFQPYPKTDEEDLLFDKLDAWDLNLEAGPAQLSFSRLEARDLGPEFLASLSLREFHYDYQPAEPLNRQDFRLEALTVGGLRLEVLKRILRGEIAGHNLWGLLAGCDTLDLVRGTLNQAGEEALGIKAANFDSVSRPNGATGFLRRLDLTVDLKALSAGSRDPFWTDLRDVAGDRLQADLNLELDYHQGSKRAELKRARLDVPELGRLELTGALGGVEPVKSHHSPSQLLLSTRDWSLERMDLSFEDRGLAVNFYRHLDRTVFRGAPSRQSATNIMNYVISPLARDLEYEQGLDNLPALVSEVEAFLERPRRLALSAEPAPPLPLMPVINSVTFMSLANQGKYDIIEKLRLTLAVNDRAPIFVAVASGVFKENLPLAPRPMENAFDEETIIEEDI